MNTFYNILKISLLGFLLISLENVYAGCNPDWCGGVTVERFYVNSSGYIYVSTSGNESLLNCTAVSDMFLTLDPAVPNADMVFSTILSAKAANQVISFQVQDGSSHCFIQYVVLE